MSTIPYKVYAQLQNRAQRGDPSASAQWKELNRKIQSREVSIGPPPAGALETAANAFADEVTMGLFPQLSRQPQFLAGEEEHPTAAGLGAAIPYLAGGAGAVKGLLQKALGRTAAKKAASQAQIDEGLQVAKDGLARRDHLSNVAQGGEFVVPAKQLTRDPAYQEALFQGMQTQPGRRPLGVKDELEEMLRQVQTRKSKLDKSPELQQFQRQNIDATRVK